MSTRSSRGRTVAATIFILALAGTAASAVTAQDPVPRSTQDADRKRLEALEKRVQELEENAKEEASPNGRWYDRLKILGFCDVTALGVDRGRRNQDGPDHASVAVGQLDLFLTA